PRTTGGHGVAAQGGADAGHLVGGDAHPGPGPAADHTGIDGALGDQPGDLLGDVGPGGVAALDGAAADDAASGALEVAGDVVGDGVAHVAADGDATRGAHRISLGCPRLARMCRTSSAVKRLRPSSSTALGWKRSSRIQLTTTCGLTPSIGPTSAGP